MLQIVFVKWGTKYGPNYVNGLKNVIAGRTTRPLRFVCITDDGSGLDPDIVVKPFPDLGIPKDVLIASGGCKLKLSMFAEGVLEPGLKSLYFDLDTGVFGDVGQLADYLDRHRRLHALPNHVVPHWRTPWLSWVTPEKCYFINSSMIVFYPEDHYDIASDFSKEYPKYLAMQQRGEAAPLQYFSDERYVSYHERGKVRAYSRSVAASFQDIYMTPSATLSGFQDRLKWVKERRARRIVLTFHGASVKPEKIVDMELGQFVRVGKFATRWNYPELSDYWAPIVGVANTAQHDQSSTVAERSVI